MKEVAGEGSMKTDRKPAGAVPYAIKTCPSAVVEDVVQCGVERNALGNLRIYLVSIGGFAITIILDLAGLFCILCRMHLFFVVWLFMRYLN